MNDRIAETLAAALMQQGGARAARGTDIDATPLDDGVLLRIHENGAISQMVLHTRRIGVRHEKVLVLAKGQLFKPEGEYIQFRNLLAFPGTDAGRADDDAMPEVAAEAIVEMQGFVVTPQGEKIEFQSREDGFFEEATGAPENQPGCVGCAQRQGLHTIQMERRIKESRCWLCTVTAVFIGVLASTALAWVAGAVVDLFGLTTLQSAAFMAGAVYTGWRAWYWGYLPFQDKTAHLIGLSR